MMKKVIKSGVKTILLKWWNYIGHVSYMRDHKQVISTHPEYNIVKPSEKLWLKKWRKYDSKLSPLSFRIFSNYIGEDLNIFPLELVRTLVEPILSPQQYDAFYNDKNVLGLMYNADIMPVTHLRNINGIFYSSDYEYLNDGGVNDILALLDTCIIKPTTSASGRGFKKFKRIKGKLVDKDGTELTYEYMICNYGKDFIIQELFAQSDFMSQFNPTSLNTIRLATYRDVKTGEIHYLRSIIRMGGKGADVDNAHAGGRFIGVDDNGYLGSYVCDNVGNVSTFHNDIDFSMSKFQVPNFENVKNLALQTASRIIHSNLLAFDIILDKDNNPKILEINNSGFGAWLFQFTSGTSFREYTDDIIEYCYNEKNKLSPLVRWYYNK